MMDDAVNMTLMVLVPSVGLHFVSQKGMLDSL